MGGGGAGTCGWVVVGGGCQEKWPQLRMGSTHWAQCQELLRHLREQRSTVRAWSPSSTWNAFWDSAHVFQACPCVWDAPQRWSGGEDRAGSLWGERRDHLIDQGKQTYSFHTEQNPTQLALPFSYQFSSASNIKNALPEKNWRNTADTSSKFCPDEAEEVSAEELAWMSSSLRDGLPCDPPRLPSSWVDLSFSGRMAGSPELPREKDLSHTTNHWLLPWRNSPHHKQSQKQRTTQPFRGSQRNPFLLYILTLRRVLDYLGWLLTLSIIASWDMNPGLHALDSSTLKPTWNRLWVLEAPTLRTAVWVWSKQPGKASGSHKRNLGGNYIL